MANQIAEYFRSYPREQAVAGVQEHLRAFWPKSMRRELAAHAAAGGEGLDPFVIEAMSREAQAESPAEKTVQGPDALGQMTSDAG
jgi:formate dehydrogenase subunit delta